MTYNQQKKFRTVNGAICSFISWFLLLYLLGDTVVNYIIHPSFEKTHSQVANRIINADTYSIGKQQMVVATKIEPASGMNKEDLDLVVGGVYIQVEYEYDGGDISDPK